MTSFGSALQQGDAPSAVVRPILNGVAMHLQQMKDLLSKWRQIKAKSTEMGSILMGQPQPDLRKGYFHSIFSPLPDSTRARFATENNLMTKFSYWRQLCEINGANLFYGKICLFGIHGGQSSALDLPFDLLVANIEGWGTLSSESSLVIGAASVGVKDLSIVENLDGTVSAFDSELSEVQQWKSLDEFQISEIERMSEFFNAEAKELPGLEGSASSLFRAGVAKTKPL